MDKTDRLRDYGLAFLLYEQGLGICGYELIRELFIFIKLILNSYLLLREFGIRNIKKVEVVVYSPYVPVMVPAYSRRNNMQQVPSIDSL